MESTVTVTTRGGESYRVSVNDVPGTLGGDASTAVALIPGLADTHDVWRDVHDLLAHGDPAPRAISYTRAGCGDSDPRPDAATGVSYRGVADELDRALTSVGIDEAVLVGHSFGGLVAQASAQRTDAATRTLGLVLVDPSRRRMYIPSEQTRFGYHGHVPETRNVGSDRLRDDPLYPDGATVIDTITGALELAEGSVPGVPTVVLTRDPAWLLPVVPGESAADRRHREKNGPAWLLHHKLLAASYDAPLIIAPAGTGHAIHTEQPDCVALAIGAVTDAVDARAATASLAPVARRLETLGCTIMTPQQLHVELSGYPTQLLIDVAAGITAELPDDAAERTATPAISRRTRHGHPAATPHRSTRSDRRAR